MGENLSMGENLFLPRTENGLFWARKVGDKEFILWMYKY
jgi:hypothetical protein